MKPGALLLTPGAGADRTHQTLVALDDAIALPTHRIDIRSRSVPKVMDIIGDAAANLVAEAGIRKSRLVLGGRSFGGRMCSMAVADGLPARGLVLLSYPLHPPGKPEKLRVEHFPKLDLPVLFVSGDRDPFGTPDEFGEHVAAIPGPVTQVWIEGARHDAKGRESEIIDAVKSWLADLR